MILTTHSSEVVCYPKTHSTSYGLPVQHWKSLACYEDMKGSAKCRKWGGLGWLRVIQGLQTELIQLPIQL